MTEKTYFAIVTQGRQGSTYLERLLDSHPNAGCSGEIFGPSSFLHYGISALDEHLQEKVHALPGKAVGFKLSMQDVMTYPELLGLVKKYGYKVIRLSRNLLDHFISGHLAIKNNAYTSDYPGRGIRTINTTSDDLKNAFQWYHFADLLLYEATSSMVSMDISYDDLIKIENHKIIYDFLEIESLPLLPVTQKQHPGSQRDRLENYEEHKAFFASTKWADKFLE